MHGSPTLPHPMVLGETKYFYQVFPNDSQLLTPTGIRITLPLAKAFVSQNFASNSSFFQINTFQRVCRTNFGTFLRHTDARPAYKGPVVASCVAIKSAQLSIFQSLSPLLPIEMMTRARERTFGSSVGFVLEPAWERDKSFK